MVVRYPERYGRRNEYWHLPPRKLGGCEAQV
jgi:predicted transglutaminase-like cysteine proteinase